MYAMDAQRYNLSHRSSPTCEERDAFFVGNARGEIPPAIRDASSIEPLHSPLLPAARSALDTMPLFNSSQCMSSSTPLPPPSAKALSCNSLMDPTFSLSDALDKDLLIQITPSSEDVSQPRQILDSTASLIAPLPRVPNAFAFPMQPLFYQSDGSTRVFSRSGSPSPISPIFTQRSRPTSPHFWNSGSPNSLEWLAPAINPPCSHFDSTTSDRFHPMSCPTSPLLQSSDTLSGHASPSAYHAMLSSVSRRLRTLPLNSTTNLIRSMSPIPSRPTSPISRTASPLLQAFSIDNWAPEKDPTEGIDIIEILVTKEISVHIEGI